LEEAKQAAEDCCPDTRKENVAPAAGTNKMPPLTPEQLVAAARLLGVDPAAVQKFDLTLNQVCDEYLEAQKGKLDRGEIRPESYREVKSRIPDVKDLLGKLKMCELTVERMDKAYKTIKLSARTISNVRDHLGAVLRWATNRRKAPDGVLKDFAAMSVTGSRKKDNEKIAPFTRPEIVALLDEAMANKFDPTKTNFRMVAVIALQAFAGFRAAEACRLPWDQINLGTGIIRATANITKTKQARTIEIPSCLRLWLEQVPHQDRQGAVFTLGGYSKARGRLARRVERKLEGFRWRSNGLRQAFIANYIAFKDSISETAYHAGTSERKIRDNYWRLVSKADAVGYFSIVPPADSAAASSTGAGSSAPAASSAKI
jgi:integrase